VTRGFEVLRGGPLTTVQDLGRFGHRAVGVGPSGAADLGAMARANALVGNAAGAAVLEATFGGVSLRVSQAARCAVTGAVCPGATMEATLHLGAGETLTLDAAQTGIRAYIAFGGGIDVPPVLGSRSTDTLSGLGPPSLAAGQLIPLGAELGPPLPTPSAAHQLPGVAVELSLTRGPRDDWLADRAWAALGDLSWEVSPDSNRVAVRLRGAALPIRTASLPPEPLVRGAVQVPPDGRPIVFLADHPVTGGYPVVGVLTAAACDLLAQCRPGTGVQLRSSDLDDDGAARPAR
jgi:biotin-dependent carboxylase-like uncharacterized protein